MKKILSALIAGAMLVSAFTACTTEAQPQESINLYTWEGMFPQEVLDSFEEETGIEVKYSSFDTDETMLSKLQTSNGGDYDVIIANDYIVDQAIQDGLVDKLDKSKIENFDNINSAYQGQFYDETDEYTVPYGAGIMTIVYDPSRVDIEINSYADLWDESLKDSVGIVDSSRVINGITLLSQGESMNTEDVAKITAAGEKLKELAPNIRVIKGDNLQDDLLSGEVSAALMYASQTTIAKLTNPELEVVFPSEGLGFGIMAQFVPSDAPNKDGAHAFIDYILQPEIAKQCFEYLGYYCTNEAADELISEEYKDFLTIPAESQDAKMEIIQTVSAEADAEHQKVWTEFKDATN